MRSVGPRARGINEPVDRKKKAEKIGREGERGGEIPRLLPGIIKCFAGIMPGK